jgi:hypothetical protein
MQTPAEHTLLRDLTFMSEVFKIREAACDHMGP